MRKVDPPICNKINIICLKASNRVENYRAAGISVVTPAFLPGLGGQLLQISERE